VATRNYEQRLRAEAAGETRRRILDAVDERLRAAPAQPVSLDRVAQLAGVSRSTIYLIFGSRAGLFDAFGADLLHRGGFEDVLRVAARPGDAQANMRAEIRGIVQMYAAHRDVLRALHSMAQLDADAVGGAVQRMEKGRADGMAKRAQRLAEQGALRPEVSIDEAIDLLCLLTSYDSFDLLHTGRALPIDEVAETLATTAERSLCR
jgi:AcrR family transcriptional regulator